MAYFPVNINFNTDPPSCAQVNMPKAVNGVHAWEGVEFKSNKATCKFTGISIASDHENEWPAPTISADGQSMQQQDLYLDTTETNHSYTIRYTDNGVAKSFDPGIQNED